MALFCPYNHNTTMSQVLKHNHLQYVFQSFQTDFFQQSNKKAVGECMNPSVILGANILKPSVNV